MPAQRDSDRTGARTSEPQAVTSERRSGHRAGPPAAAETAAPSASRTSPSSPPVSAPGVGNRSSAVQPPPDPTELAPSISLPKGGGALKNIGEKFAANAFSGGGGMSVPIAVSPARDLTPTLVLGYSTGAGNGPYGIGWQLSVPAISRKTDRGLPTYDDAREGDVFLLSDAEDLVPLLDPDGDDWVPRVREEAGHRVHAYRPRVESAFARIERWVELATGEVHWRTWSRDNVRSTYGTTAESRISAPGGPSRVFSWLIDETRDDRGNIVAFEYKPEDLAGVVTEALNEHERLAVDVTQPQRYLWRIHYGNAVPDVAGAWRFEVRFDYGEHDEFGADTGTWPARADTFSNFRPGFDLRTRRLCRRVLMFHHFGAALLVSATELTYDENPVAALLTAVRRRGYARIDDEYKDKAYPALEFTYSAAEVDTTLHFLDKGSLENLPGAVAGGRFDLVDLDGEGLPGILIQQDGAWYYKRNEGGGRFGAVRRLPSVPQPQPFGAQRLLDLDGDGQLSVVSFAAPARGYFDRARTPCGNVAEDWAAFRSFHELPDIDLDRANVQFIDLDGDGFADLLVVEDDRFVWYPSRGKDGFGEPRVLTRPRDERAGPRLAWSDPQQSIYYSDMTGDGLTDIVRVRNGSVDYWPNLGHGRFGRKIGMRGAPVFDRPDRFRADRIRLGDIDGSGTTDIVYVRDDGAHAWRNQAGNSFSAAVHLDGFPPVDGLASVELTDLLGKGTAALVWSTDLPNRQGTHVAYMDLMAAGKPYLMRSAVNNLGGETRVAYAPSTKYYLEDRAAGRPWKTRLPFPTHVVDRVEVRDHVTGHTFVQTYRYRHGYFDGPEREFRGFGMVEVEDTESWADYNAPKLFPTGHEIVDEELHSPPVRTRTWFHTGAYLGESSLSRCWADEYYSDKTAENPDGIAVDLADSELPDGLTPVERREAVRALRGRALRVEVYGLDGSEAAAHPYTVTESNFAVRRLQPRTGERHAAFFVHDRETLNYHYERDPADPRVSHTMVLAVDDFGNVLESASIAYPRPVAAGARDEQKQTAVVHTTATFVNVAASTDRYRLGVPVETRVHEVGGLVGDPTAPFAPAALRAYVAGADEVPYEATPGADEKRLLSRVQQYYYADDLLSPLSLGGCGLRALPYETLALAFTKAQLTDVFAGKLGGLALDTEGGYREADTFWWRPSGRVVFDPDRFYRVVQVRDVFGHTTLLSYDADGLLLESAQDPLGNTITATNDYRVLAPSLVTDPNGNRQAAAFDELGMVVRVAVMGKDGDSDGDTLEHPTIEIAYDLDAWALERPVFVHTTLRETHGAGATAFQESYAYSGGLGQVVLTKVQAEPGLAPQRDGSGELVFDGDELVFADTGSEVRWIGTGRTFVDNKGNPVKQYEPFFDSTPAYTDEQELARWGVTPLLHYDPLGRPVRVDLPDGTFTTVAWTPWQQTAHDANDNILTSDWYAERQALTPGTPANDAEIDAADDAAAHADTPTTTLLDHLGRPFATLAHNGFDGDDPILFETHVTLDVEGNPRVVTDALEIATELDVFAPVGLQLRTTSPDAGVRWALPNALGNPLRHWDSRGNVRRWTYDALNRPTHAYLKHASDDEKLQTRTLYGESLGVVAPDTNHRGKAFRVYDSAGVVTSLEYDFKGNLLGSERRLAEDYTAAPDWIDLAPETDPATIAGLAAGLLEAGAFTTTWTYDALDRPVTQTTPDASVTTQSFGAGGLLESVTVHVRGAVDPTDIVTDIDYNARGQRTLIVYGNGSETAYEYDPKNFRIRRIHTERPNPDPGLRTVQDLRYHHDPSGNVAVLRDEAQQGVFFANAYVDATQHFVYDPTYRLVEATGRELADLTLPTADGFVTIPHPQTSPHAQRTYIQTYAYDAVGNIKTMQHVAAGGGWKRHYDYSTPDPDPDPPLELQPQSSNRLRATSTPSDLSSDPEAYLDVYEYDEHGNMTAMPSIPGGLTWDDDDRLQKTDRVGGGVTFYVYDGAGQRVRKVHINDGETVRKQRLYFGPWELYREEHNINTTPVLDRERETLHVHDDAGRVCMIETRTIEDEDPVVDPPSVTRYQYLNHLGTATLELDGAAEVISYEEFHPYGTSSYAAANDAIEVSPKRYRYTGKERDEETGLAYHGARYYACWLARWNSPDPLGIIDGSGRYSYCRDNPVCFADQDGNRAAEPSFTDRFLDFIADPFGEAASTIESTAKKLSGVPEVSEDPAHPLSAMPRGQRQVEGMLELPGTVAKGVAAAAEIQAAEVVDELAFGAASALARGTGAEKVYNNPLTPEAELLAAVLVTGAFLLGGETQAAKLVGRTEALGVRGGRTAYRALMGRGAGSAVAAGEGGVLVGETEGAVAAAGTASASIEGRRVLRMPRAVGADVATVRVRHYTRKSSLKPIEESKMLVASDQNAVFAVRARGNPGSPRDVEKALGIKKGKGGAYVEFDAVKGEYEIVENKLTGATEYVFQENVSLEGRNPVFKVNR